MNIIICRMKHSKKIIEQQHDKKTLNYVKNGLIKTIKQCKMSQLKLQFEKSTEFRRIIDSIKEIQENAIRYERKKITEKEYARCRHRNLNEFYEILQDFAKDYAEDMMCEDCIKRI